MANLSLNGRQLRRIDVALIAAIIVQLALWVYSQGRVAQQLEDVRADVAEIKSLLLHKAVLP